MTLTYGGSLGIGVTLPTNTLHVVGTSTVTNNAYVGSNLYVASNLYVSGTLNLPSGSNDTDTIKIITSKLSDNDLAIIEAATTPGEKADALIEAVERVAPEIKEEIEAKNKTIDNDAKMRFDNTLNLSNISNRGPEPSHDNASNPIQNPIATSKSNWCLVGEYDGKRGCVEVGESDKCISNQLFPSQQLCLNPTLTK